MKHTVLLIALFVFCQAFLVSPIQAQERSGPFTETERQKVIGEIDKELKRSDDASGVNKGYDVGFKVVLFIVSILAAVGAARVAAMPKEEVPRTWLKTSNLALTALVPLITTLAFTQFEFPKRQAIWEKRYYALLGCKLSLTYSNPSRDTVLGGLDAIFRWNDFSALNELTASCTTKTAQDTGTALAKQTTTLPASPAAPSAAASPSTSASPPGTANPLGK